jgi:competence ComEA-like helix-hairpin-helix protein
MASSERDQRLLVLFFVALLIILFHGYQVKQRNKEVLSLKNRHVWLSGVGFSSIYAVPERGIPYKNLFEHLGISPPKDHEEQIFSPAPRTSYSLTPYNLPQQIENNFRAAPFFFLPIPINQTDRNTLTTVPGIGEKLAEKIISYRNKHGNYNTLEELQKVDGIGKKKLKTLKKWVSL